MPEPLTVKTFSVIIALALDLVPAVGLVAELLVLEATEVVVEAPIAISEVVIAVPASPGSTFLLPLLFLLPEWLQLLLLLFIPSLILFNKIF